MSVGWSVCGSGGVVCGSGDVCECLVSGVLCVSGGVCLSGGVRVGACACRWVVWGRCVDARL